MLEHRELLILAANMIKFGLKMDGTAKIKTLCLLSKQLIRYIDIFPGFKKNKTSIQNKFLNFNSVWI